MDALVQIDDAGANLQAARGRAHPSRGGASVSYSYGTFWYDPNDFAECDPYSFPECFTSPDDPYWTPPEPDPDDPDEPDEPDDPSDRPKGADTFGPIDEAIGGGIFAECARAIDEGRPKPEYCYSLMDNKILGAPGPGQGPTTLSPEDTGEDLVDTGY